MGARAGKYQKQRSKSFAFEKTRCIGLACRLVPVQYRGFANGLSRQVALKMLYFVKKLLTAKLALLEIPKHSIKERKDEHHTWKPILFSFFFCFSTWGESLFKAGQTCFLVILVFYYTNRPLAAVLFPFLYGAIVYVLLSGLTPIAVLVQLVSLNILFLIISRVSSFFMLYELCLAVLITHVKSTKSLANLDRHKERNEPIRRRSLHELDGGERCNQC